MKRLLLSATLLAAPFFTMAQTLSGDSILANERSIDRPITLHARQFRITGGYGLSIIARRFDGNAESVRLRDEGLASIRHRFNVDIKYGINDFIQLNAAIGHASNVVREQTRYIFPINEEPTIVQDVLHEYKGIEDLYVGLDLRAPLRTRKVDIAITFAATFPVANAVPDMPRHSFEAVEEGGFPYHKFVYRHYHSMGQGVMVGQVGGMVKYRSSTWAISARADYRHGLEEGQSHVWRHQLDDGRFEYMKRPITYRIPDANYYFVEGEYQPLPWFDLFMIVSGHTAFKGWTSTADNLRVATPYQTSWVVSPGFEIIVTPRLWLRERINIAVAGKNYEAPLSFQTTMMYNFFPIR